MDWVRALSTTSSSSCCLVVAGDVADTFAATVSALGELKARFGRVFYVPGNHELFLRGESDARAFPDSWCKLFALRQACIRLGVETSPALVPGGRSTVAVVAPLLSWYDDGAFAGLDPATAAPSPLRFDAPCDWGPVREQDVHRVMLSLGRRDLAQAAQAGQREGGAEEAELLLITMSHFLPRRELPFHRGVMERAMGCVALSSAVLPSLGAAVFGGGEPAPPRRHHQHVHVYGHSHVNADRGELGDGVRYVQHALAAGGGPCEEVAGGGERVPHGLPAAAALGGPCRCFAPRVLWRAPPPEEDPAA
jgi:hypothetical protein